MTSKFSDPVFEFRKGCDCFASRGLKRGGGGGGGRRVNQ